MHFGLVLVFVAGLLALAASPASAHAQFQSAASGYAAGSSPTLRLYVPNERDDTNYNAAVTVYLPESWSAVSCATKATWTCALGAAEGRPTVTFTKAAGAAPAEDDYFEFVVRVGPTPGTYTLPTIQTYNDGQVVRWIGAKGSEDPAPTLVALPGDATPAPVTPTTAHGAASVTTSTTSASDGSGVVIPDSGQATTTTAEPLAALPSGGEGGGGSSPVLLIGGVVVVLAAVGGALALRRQRRTV